MKKLDAENLVVAGLIDSVVIYGDENSINWEVWFHGDYPAYLGPQIETARGEVRRFVELKTALSFIRSCGWQKVVQIVEQQQGQRTSNFSVVLRLAE